jgi:hypothetical protein
LSPALRSSGGRLNARTSVCSVVTPISTLYVAVPSAARSTPGVGSRSLFLAARPSSSHRARSALARRSTSPWESTSGRVDHTDGAGHLRMDHAVVAVPAHGLEGHRERRGRSGAERDEPRVHERRAVERPCRRLRRKQRPLTARRRLLAGGEEDDRVRLRPRHPPLNRLPYGDGDGLWQEFGDNDVRIPRVVEARLDVDPLWRGRRRCLPDRRLNRPRGPSRRRCRAVRRQVAARPLRAVGSGRGWAR